jgi:hypothetical protein
MLDPKMKEEMIENMKKLGLDESRVDDNIIWGAKKMMYGMAKVMWSLKESGIEGEKAKKILKKIADMMMKKDMTDKMEKMVMD